MKFTERSAGLFIEDIRSEDVRYSNLAGRLTGSIYEDPNKPQHVYILWLKSPELVDIFRQLGVNVKETNEYDRIMNSTSESESVKKRREELMSNPKLAKEAQETVEYSVRFKTYPKMRARRNGNGEEQYPKIMLKTETDTVPLEAASFGLADSSAVSMVSADMRFHLFEYDPRKPRIAVLDELWITVNETAGEKDSSYLAEKYGYIEEDQVPFE